MKHIHYQEFLTNFLFYLYLFFCQIIDIVIDIEIILVLLMKYFCQYQLLTTSYFVFF